LAAESGALYSGEILPLAGGSAGILLPADPKLGRLIDSSSLTGERRRILDRVRSFFQRLDDEVSGEEGFDDELLEEFIEDAVEETLLLSIEQWRLESFSASRIRYAAVETVDRGDGRISARVDLRIRGGDEEGAHGGGKGEVFLLLKEGTWYVSAINIDPASILRLPQTGNSMLK